jgi:hypothetical protein
VVNRSQKDINDHMTVREGLVKENVRKDSHITAASILHTILINGILCVCDTDLLSLTHQVPQSALQVWHTDSDYQAEPNPHVSHQVW